MTPAPITATARTVITTTVTPSIAISAAQTGLVYTSFAGPWAPLPGAYAIRPGYGAADHQYHIGSAFVDPSGVGIYGYPDAGQVEVGAIGGVPGGAVGYVGPRSIQCKVVMVGELARCRVTSRPPGEATELDQRRSGPPGTTGTRVYPRTLCTRTRPWSVDVSGG